MKTNKIRTISFKPIIFSIIFLGLGICFIIAPKIFSRRMENWIQTTGVIIKIEETRTSKTAIVKYYVESEKKDYTGNGDVYISTYKVGTEVDVKYNPAKPDEFTMDVTYKMTTVPFVITGSVFIAIASATVIFEILKGTSAKKQVLSTNSELSLNYMPSFMFEYVPLKAENHDTYKFKPQIRDFNNYEVTDSQGKTIFFTKRIKKGITSSATYQLIDSITKQTTIVNIKKSSNAGKISKGGLKIKVDNLPIDEYFERRHLIYNISKEGNETKYTLLNNGSTLGFIYEQNSQIKNFEIETAKENIDDLSLFALCLTFR